MHTRPRAEYYAMARSDAAARSGEEFHVIELSVDPRRDWPMVPVRLRQDVVQSFGPFILSTSDARTRVSLTALEKVGFKEGFAAVSNAPAADPLAVFAIDELELA